MTLVVAAIENGTGWLVADTAITGGNIELRDREYAIKARPIGSRGVVAFSGDSEIGNAIICEISKYTEHDEIVTKAALRLKNNSAVDLAIMILDNSEVNLYKVTGNGARKCTTLHLGSDEAFDRFQAIRHRNEIEHSPDALHIFSYCAYTDDEPPAGVTKATIAMLELFASNQSHDVGGWPVPYMLGANGVSLVSFGYAVSDPVISSLSQGDAISHGTAEAGGFGISICALDRLAGVVVYWLQRPGGFIYIEEPTGYRAIAITGRPAEFKAQGRSATGFEVDIWFSEQPLSDVTSASILRDEDGRARVSVASADDSFAFAWLGIKTATPFRTIAGARVGEGVPMEIKLKKGGVLTLADVAMEGTLLQYASDESEVSIELSADDIDSIIAALANHRSSIKPVIPEKLVESTQVQAVRDPAWRIEPSPISGDAAALIHFRHVGFGWVSFLLPPDEAAKLGGLLCQSGATPKRD